ncbi:MAG: arginine--tRNA ligase [Proteobacteria bacterium]|nr:arginine--tRNA ligase [Pseudomonadota bacterium]
MNVFADFQARIARILKALPETAGLADAALARVVVEPPRDSSHGDLSTNAAMVTAKDASMKPRDLAELIATALAGETGVAAVSVAGPGFINITLDAAVFDSVLRVCIAEGAAYSRTALGKGEGVNVEYVSANPTGPMHVGHCRGAVYGDALANLLAATGHVVTREYYINDAGAQVDVLARSAFLRYLEALGEDIGTIPDGLYPGDYLKPVGAALAERYGSSLKDQPEAEWLPTVRQFAIDAMMAMIRDDLSALNITHEVFFSERSLQAGGNGGAVAAIIDDFRKRGLIYEGRLPPPKGQLPDDWEDREQTLFRSTEFGDDVDRPLIKSDGGYTYFASDIAYHADKFKRGFKTQIDVWGADHGGYIKRMAAAVKAASNGEATLEVRLCQLVKLMRNGEPVKMSKRSGDFVTLREVVDEVGRDSVRFMMLFRKNDAELEFDLAKVIEQSKDNPVFYVQYAHARGASIFRQGRQVFPDMDVSSAALAKADLSILADSSERELIRRIAAWPRLLDSAAQSREPHRIAFFLEDVAAQFHALWNKGKDQPDLRFINAEDRYSTLARLALVRGVMNILAGGLALLGVGAPDEMQ